MSTSYTGSGLTMTFTTLLVMYLAGVALFFLSHRVQRALYITLTKLTGYALLFSTALVLYYYNLVDYFSLALGLSFTLLSFFISMYTVPYRKVHHYPKYLEILVDFFHVSIVSAYIAPSFILMIVAWTTGEIVGYTLIKLGEERSMEGSLTSSRGYLFTSTLTYELSVFTLITLSVFLTVAGIGLYELLKPFTGPSTTFNVPLLIMPLLMVGFITKTANMPLHFWLPSAHSSAPSPASATLSGLMVSLGYYGLYRLMNMVNVQGYRVVLAWLFILIGMLSIVYGGLQALTQRDVKKLLAYSTIATDGFVSVIFGLYVLEPLEITRLTLLTSIIMHAAYKTTLFCESGLIEAVYGTRYIHGIRGFVKIAPLSTLGGLLALFSLFGVPGTLGFLAKLLAIYCSTLVLSYENLMFIASLLAFLAYIVISALIALKYVRVYYGDSSSKVEALVENVNRGLQAPVLALGLLNALLSLVVALLFREYSYLIILAVPLPVITAYLAHMQIKVHSERVVT